jgi:hypothetical protein
MVREGFSEAEISGWLGLSKRETATKIAQLQKECEQEGMWGGSSLESDSDSTGSEEEAKQYRV